MSKITNSFHQCELLNIGLGPNGRGPFLVRQEGYLPGSTTFTTERYLLRHDGTWVLNLAVFALPDAEKEKFFFQTSAEAMHVLDGLSGEPVLETALPPNVSRAELMAAAESTISGLWGRIRAAKPSTASA